MKKPLALIFLVLLADQVLKVYIKTHYSLGESHSIIGDWSYIFFIENEGMAFGWKFFGAYGKLMLSIFRIVAATGIFYYLYTIVKKGAKPGMVLSFALIFAGAAGNIIDSMFYGLFFTESTLAAPALFSPGNGYAGFLHGKVVDMFYFPLIEGYWPEWKMIPASLRGDHFLFFRPVFNIADSSITVGVATLLLFQKRFFHPGEEKPEAQEPIADQPEEPVSESPEKTASAENQS